MAPSTYKKRLPNTLFITRATNVSIGRDSRDNTIDTAVDVVVAPGFSWNCLQGLTATRAGNYFNRNASANNINGGRFGDNAQYNVLHYLSNVEMGTNCASNYLASVTESKFGHGCYQNVICAALANCEFDVNCYANYFAQNTVQECYFGYQFNYNRVYDRMLRCRFTAWTYNNQFDKPAEYTEFGANCTGNNFGAMTYNRIADLCQNNTFTSDGFEYNDIGHGFSNNTIGGGFARNVIAAGFTYNVIGDNFGGNVIGDKANFNVIGDGFISNKVGTRFTYNTFYSSVENNVIGDDFANNTVGDAGYDHGYFFDNVIGNDFTKNTIGANFKKNDVKTSIGLTDFTSATHVYRDYNCTIFLDSTSSNKLKYTNGSGVDVVVNVTD